MDKKKKNALLNQAKTKAALASAKLDEAKVLNEEISGNEVMYLGCNKLKTRSLKPQPRT